MKSRMMISSVSGRSMRTRRSMTVGRVNSTSVRMHRNTFSKFPLRNWAPMVRMTRTRRMM